MITLHWHNETHESDIAVRGCDYVALYDKEYNETFRIFNINGHEWENISIEGGDWTSEYEIPTLEDKLRADINFLRNSIGSIELSMKATDNYMEGQLLYVKDILYKTTENVGKGSLLIDGVNVIKTTLSEQIKELK